MNIKTEILKDQSKMQAIKIVDYVESDPERFKELMDLFFNHEYRIAQRAAWPVGICAEKHPWLIGPYIKSMLENLQKGKVHDATKRNTFRVLQYIQMPDEHLELATHTCFHYFSNKAEAIAIRIFAMTVLAHICTKLPDLKEELSLLIEDELPYGAPAFISRGRKILKLLKK